MQYKDKVRSFGFFFKNLCFCLICLVLPYTFHWIFFSFFLSLRHIIYSFSSQSNHFPQFPLLLSVFLSIISLPPLNQFSLLLFTPSHSSSITHFVFFSFLSSSFHSPSFLFFYPFHSLYVIFFPSFFSSSFCLVSLTLISSF